MDLDGLNYRIMKSKRITEKEQSIKTIMDITGISERRADFIYREIRRYQMRFLYRYLAWVCGVAAVSAIAFSIYLFTH